MKNIQKGFYIANTVDKNSKNYAPGLFKMKSEHEGICVLCKKEIKKGETILWSNKLKSRHSICF